MSFLNPVNEPVLRFSSTDADAPQINYNARVAGDVKAVLKACLVTGYGTTASAGWSVVNEVDHVAEFVSPSVAMSDYRLGIDDTSASKTNWYYQYQDARTNPANNNPSKSFAYADKSHLDNGWQLFATERGIMFVELVQHTAVSKLSARITYWGQVKSTLIDDAGKNIMFFNVGHSSTGQTPAFFYSSAGFCHLAVLDYNSCSISTATTNILSSNVTQLEVSQVDLSSSIYVADASKTLLIAQLPPMLSALVNKKSDIYGVDEFNLSGRSVISVCAGIATTIAYAYNESRTFLIPTDYWEY